MRQPTTVLRASALSVSGLLGRRQSTDDSLVVIVAQQRVPLHNGLKVDSCSVTMRRARHTSAVVVSCGGAAAAAPMLIRLLLLRLRRPLLCLGGVTQPIHLPARLFNVDTTTREGLGRQPTSVN